LNVPKNFFYDSIEALKHIVVPEAQHAKAGFSEHLAAHGVAFSVFGMLATINFDNQFRFYANEVDDVAVDHELTPELATGQPSAS